MWGVGRKDSHPTNPPLISCVLVNSSALKLTVVVSPEPSVAVIVSTKVFQGSGLLEREVTPSGREWTGVHGSQCIDTEQSQPVGHGLFVAEGGKAQIGSFM